MRFTVQSIRRIRAVYAIATAVQYLFAVAWCLTMFWFGATDDDTIAICCIISALIFFSAWFVRFYNRKVNGYVL